MSTLTPTGAGQPRGARFVRCLACKQLTVQDRLNLEAVCKCGHVNRPA